MSQKRALLARLPLLLLAAACSSAPPQSLVPGPVPPPPASAVTPPAAQEDPFATPSPLREEQLPLLKGPAPVFADVALAAPPKGVAPPPKTCDALLKRAPRAQAKAACPGADKRLEALDAALTKPAGDETDQALVDLEACASFEPGVIRTLRIELAPPACGDVLAAPLLAKKFEGMPGAVQHALVGHALAARLARAVDSPPKLAAPYTKDRVVTFAKGPLITWFNDQALAVQALSASGAELGTYGKGLVALAAGTADLRMVDAFRDIPIPDEFKKDPELAGAYYAALDEKLEPRKARGRDGALVGLRELSHAGVITSTRTTEARRLLAKLFGGRRVDSLDALVVPKSPAAPTDTAVARLAAKLPTFHANLLLDPAEATNVGVLRAMTATGIPVRFRAALKEAQSTLPDDVRSAYARLRLMMGVTYWRADDVDAVVGELTRIPAATRTKDDRFVLALALALRSGPEDLAALMRSNEPFKKPFADVRALDVVASEDKGSPLGGHAAFDAAVLRQIAAPRDADGKYWESLGERYRVAAGMITEQSTRHEADERSKAAFATAKAITVAGP